MAETYDEVVFTDPTEQFYQHLLQVASLPPIEMKETRVQQAVLQYNDQDEFLALIEAKKFLERELVTVKDRFQQVERGHFQVDEAIREVQEKIKTRKAQQREKAASNKKLKTGN